MNISPEEKKRIDNTLSAIMDASNRSIVSLRKGDFNNLTLDIENLAHSISVLLVENGIDFLPGSGV